MAEVGSLLSPGRRLAGLGTCAALAAVLAISIVGTAEAKGPVSVAEVAEPLLDAVVNISTSQTVSGSRGIPVPRLPEGSPFQEFFDEFFDQRPEENDRPRRVQSLGSGFVIDTEGYIVTNNHVVDGATRIEVNFLDGTIVEGEIVGLDPDSDLAGWAVTSRLVACRAAGVRLEDVVELLRSRHS